MSKYTDWFSGHNFPPRPGVYQRRFHDGREQFSRWDGNVWMEYRGTADHAAMCNHESAWQHLQWRGLKKEPKK